MYKHTAARAGESHLQFTEKDRGGGPLHRSPHKERPGKENKHNPSDKSRIVAAFIWTRGAWLGLDPNETAACPERIHHPRIRVIAARRAPLLLIRLLSGHSLSAAVRLWSCQHPSGAADRTGEPDRGVH